MVGKGSLGWVASGFLMASLTSTKLPLCPGTWPRTHSRLRAGSTCPAAARQTLSPRTAGRPAALQGPGGRTCWCQLLPEPSSSPGTGSLPSSERRVACTLLGASVQGSRDWASPCPWTCPCTPCQERCVPCTPGSSARCASRRPCGRASSCPCRRARGPASRPRSPACGATCWRRARRAARQSRAAS